MIELEVSLEALPGTLAVDDVSSVERARPVALAVAEFVAAKLTLATPTAGDAAVSLNLAPLFHDLQRRNVDVAMQPYAYELIAASRKQKQKRS